MSSAIPSRPKQVLIIRHGEKYGVPDADAVADATPDPGDQRSILPELQEDQDYRELNGNPDPTGQMDLSIRGSARAMALPSLFVKSGWQRGCELKPTSRSGVAVSYRNARQSGTLPRFSVPDAIFATKKSNGSNRPWETVIPLSVCLEISIRHDIANAQFGQVARVVFTKHPNQTVLICWHHGNIPKLAQEFGINNPPKWPGSVFDRIWQITWVSDRAGAGPLLEDLPQRLLFGDSLI